MMGHLRRGGWGAGGRRGEFVGQHFAFRVHSPSRAGLKVGVTCMISAKWNGSGYLVDENQWRGAPR